MKVLLAQTRQQMQEVRQEASVRLRASRQRQGGIIRGLWIGEIKGG